MRCYYHADRFASRQVHGVRMCDECYVFCLEHCADFGKTTVTVKARASKEPDSDGAQCEKVNPCELANNAEPKTEP